MRFTIILTILFLSCNYPVNSCTEVYLIRHAEKDRTDPLNKNPHLNKNGKERSLLWNQYFKNNKIDAIYSTNYNRTIETILPISISKGIKPIIYSPTNINYDSFLKKEKGRKIQFTISRSVYKIYELDGDLGYFLVQVDGKSSLLVKQSSRFLYQIYFKMR